MVKQYPISLLSKYGFNEKFIKILKKDHITNLFESQFQVVAKGLFQGNSFLLCTPSGSGKTLVAELAAIHRISKNEGKVLFLLPYRALVSEKYFLFYRRYRQFGYKFAQTTGGIEVSKKNLEFADLYFMTYEKFDSFLRSKMQNSWIHQIGLVIIDEIHILGEKDRGARLENLIIRILNSSNKVQILFFSATIGNPEVFHQWCAKIYKFHNPDKKLHLITTNLRPTDLKYLIQISKNKNNSIKKILEKSIANNSSILVFTYSRNDTEKTCDFLLHEPIITQFQADKMYLLQYLTENFQNIDFRNIRQWKYIQNGLGYHHAGLSTDERLLIEQLYLHGLIKILVATSTLSAGINTPAKIVILKSIFLYEKVEDHAINPMFKKNTDKRKKYKKKIINCNEFHQICGRAGRMEYESNGYAYILVDNFQEREWLIQNYFTTKNNKSLIPKYQNIQSSISFSQDILEEIVLLRIYEQGSSNFFELEDFLRTTFHSYNSRKNIPVGAQINLYPLDIISMIMVLSNKISELFLKKRSYSVIILEYSPEKELIFKVNLKYNKKFERKPENQDSTFCVQLLISKGVRYARITKNEFNFKFTNTYSKFPFDNDDFLVYLLTIILHRLRNIEYISKNEKLRLFSPIQKVEFSDSRNQINISTFQKDAERICYKSIFQRSIVENLGKYNVIEEIKIEKETAFPRFRCTNLGKICLNNFLLPKYILPLYFFAKHLIKSSVQLTLIQILPGLIPIIQNLFQIDANQINTCLNLWISEYDYKYIIKKIQKLRNSRFSINDLLHLTEKTAQLIKVLIDLIHMISPTTFIGDLKAIMKRIRFGLKSPSLIRVTEFSELDVLFIRNNILSSNA
ncbi:MAG: DEAD/DEAH box helicase [Candidatus Lokiarchaeota archaeon]|nr:DEAD/DEAH box helicase [Candidatus Harpocratesius repetitus]